MNKIATHDSATGEKPVWYSWLLAPFAKTQSKTIEEQYEAGCRMFDLRVKNVKGNYALAHGGYIIKRSIASVLTYLDKRPQTCYVTLTYEGRLGEHGRWAFTKYAQFLRAAHYRGIVWGPVAVKKGKGSGVVTTKYDYLLAAQDGFPRKTESDFEKLDGSTKRWLIPIPWLWKKLRHNEPEFNEETFKYVDFL